MEDTGRSKGSAFGPNISDMTLKLANSTTLLPVIRRPNFSDETADVPIANYNLTIGNETKGATLKRIPLKDYLENANGTLKDASGKVVNSLFCKERDSVILTSAQYCVLPLSNGTCEFNVHLYNYQSSIDSPAVLVLVSSATGTSAQGIYGGTTALYFNNDGQAANYVAEWLKDERARLGKEVEGTMDKDEQQRNALFIFQIPLIPKKPKATTLSTGLIRRRCPGTSNGSEGKKGVDNAVLSVWGKRIPSL